MNRPAVCFHLRALKLLRNQASSMIQVYKSKNDEKCHTLAFLRKMEESILRFQETNRV